MGRFGVLIFTDIVLGAIAILIIIIVLNRPKHETVTHIPQAGYVLECINITKNQPFIIVKGASNTPISFDNFLNNTIVLLPKSSARLAISRNSEPVKDSKCVKSLKKQIKNINKAFDENRDQIHYPYIFVSEFLRINLPKSVEGNAQ